MCEKQSPYCNRESGFFVIAIETFFSFRQNWHQDDRVNPLVRQFQTALDSVLNENPGLQRCVAHCAYCEIRFLAHPRNAGRRDLRCPFGCRDHHRRQQSNQRSTAYYQTSAGKIKKKHLNTARHGHDACSTDCQRQQEQGLPQNPADDGGIDVLLTDDHRVPDEVPDEGSRKIELRLGGVVLDETSLANSSMLPYLRMVVSLIEGAQRSQNEIVELLRQAMRQHSIATRRRTDYVLCFLHQHPP